MRLKRHETPRKQGRNFKSKLASARLRQLKKRTKTLIKKLYENPLLFRNRIMMAKHSFGSGEYQYFADPLPDIVRRLRETAIPHFFRSEGEPLGHVRLSDRIGRQPGIRRIVLAREIDKDGLRIPHRHFAIFKRRHFSKWMTGQMF